MIELTGGRVKIILVDYCVENLQHPYSVEFTVVKTVIALT